MTAIFDFLTRISPLSDDAQRVLLGMLREESLGKGNYFALAGNVETQYGLLTAGVMRAFYRNADGEEYNKTLFTPVSFVGAYASLVSGQPNQIYLQALTDCTVWTAPYASLTSNYDRFPDLERLARKLAERYYVVKEQRELEIVMLDAGERYQLFQQQFPTLEQLIPQYHIASYLGITPTQLSRIRRSFARND